VYAHVRDINNAWSDYKHPTVVPPSDPRPPETLLYGPLDTAMARLREAAAARRTTETMAAANDVSAAAFELIEYYNPSVPPGLARLAVLERKILVDSWDGRIDTAQILWSRSAAPGNAAGGRRPLQREEWPRPLSSNLADQQAALDALESSGSAPMPRMPSSCSTKWSNCRI
jgi:hypothetical protein